MFRIPEHNIDGSTVLYGNLSKTKETNTLYIFFFHGILNAYSAILNNTILK